MSDPTEAACQKYPELREMLNEVASLPAELEPSRYWQKLSRKNLQQLSESGYENFKRTLARNYFTWVVPPLSRQGRFLMRDHGYLRSARVFWQALRTPRFAPMKKKHTVYYTILTRLLWSCVERRDSEGLLRTLVEPAQGNPPAVLSHGRLISQDLANSVLEYRSILHPEVDRRKVRTILELGPGYGRTAYVFLALQPACRYVLVDIPPALYVAQRYLTSVFPDRRVFAFRPFDEFAQVREEMEDCSIIFLTPNQLGALPDKSIDMFVNISSFHEMRMDQIRYYFTEIERLTRKYLYLKQWQHTTVPLDNETIRESDYPVDPGWRLINRQPCVAQNEFFEALYELNDPGDAGRQARKQ